MKNNKHQGSLLKRSYKINQVLLGEQTKIEGDTLYIDENLCKKSFDLADQNIILKMDLHIISPSEYESYIDTILDVIPLAVKEKNSILGEGVTRSLSGVVMTICGKDEVGEQISEAGSCEGIFSHKVRFDRPGSIDNGETVIKIDFLIKSGERMKRPGPLACHKAADHISEEIRAALLALSEEEFTSGCINEQEFVHIRRAGKPKVLLVKEIMGQGAMHEKLLLPLQPCGITGARSNIDMGNIPIMLSPLESIDGAVHALTCVGPSTKETSRHYYRDPLITLALLDEDIDICGVAFVGSPPINQQKYMVAERLGMLVSSLDVSGVIVATEGYGNNHIDFAAHLEAIGKRGIPAVGVTFCGNFGPLITGNKYTRYLVDCTKADIGLENSILADNTMIEEDARIALGMLKSVMRGERVAPPPRRWDTTIRDKNLKNVASDGEEVFQSEIPTATMPPIVWTPVTKPLSEMKIALVSGTGVHSRADQRFSLSCDSSFRIIPEDTPTYDLTISHGGYDNTDALTDINSMFPLDPLRKLAEEGLIAGIAPRHIGFMGGGGDLKKLANETGPAIAEILKNDGVDAAIFTAG
jgi:D-proline reductase (dithiol) PrdA